MASPTVEVSVSGNTVTVTADFGGATPSVSFSPDPHVSPVISQSGNVFTFTFSDLPNGTYTGTVTCPKALNEIGFHFTITTPGDESFPVPPDGSR
jgi:hypothetical protein